MKKLQYSAFILFSVFYLLTASIYALPGITILRWVGSGLLLGIAWLSARKPVIFFPKSFIFIVLALIPTILGRCGAGTFYAYERIISFFLVTLSLSTFLMENQITIERIYNLFEIYTFIAGVLMILSIVRDFTLEGRMQGVYMNPNFLSCVALFTAAASLAMFYILKRKRRWLYGIFFIVSVLCVVGTGSRMGIVCIGIIIYSIPIISAKTYTLKDMSIQFLKLIITTIIFIYILKHFDILAIDRLFSQDISTSGATGFTRGDAWEDVAKIFNAKPILGWGYASVGYNVFQVLDNTFNWGMHSSYFIILCEMGIIGSFLFLSFFIGFSKKIFIRYKELNCKTYTERCFVKFLVLCCIIMLINAYSESFLFSVGNPMAICFWFPATLLYSYVYKLKIKGN